MSDSRSVSALSPVLYMQYICLILVWQVNLYQGRPAPQRDRDSAMPQYTVRLKSYKLLDNYVPRQVFVGSLLRGANAVP